MEIPLTNTHVTTPILTTEDFEALKLAHRRLEFPGFIVRVSNALGAPLENLSRNIPEGFRESLNTALHQTLEKTLEIAIHTLDKDGSVPSPRSGLYHKTLGAMSGAASGMFGLPAIIAELPITSAIMLRSIADIARSEGEDLSDPASRLACMEVFALGGRSPADDAAEIGYYGLRVALGSQMPQLSEQILNQGLSKLGKSGFSRFITEIASRYGIVISEKTAVQIVPILGAGAGGLINVLFMDHYQETARGHFTMRRLERRYGSDVMQSEYARLLAR